MTRKKIKHEQIASDSKRNTVFKQRLEGLLKKANELSILCGVEIGIVIDKPDENLTLMWPSPQIFWERMHKFLSFSDVERAKKMVTHDKYLEQRLNDERKLLEKFQKRNREKELHNLMDGLLTQGKDINQLDLHQLSTLHSFTTELLEKLRNRNEELSNDQRYRQPLQQYTQPLQQYTQPFPQYTQSLALPQYTQPLPLPQYTQALPLPQYTQPLPQYTQPLSLPQYTEALPLPPYTQPLPLSIPPQSFRTLTSTEAPMGSYSGTETSIFEELRGDQWFMENMFAGQDGDQDLMGFAIFGGRAPDPDPAPDVNQNLF